MKINERLKRLRELMKSKGIDAYIVPTTDPHGSEYVAEHYKGRSFISGFTGSAGTVVITHEKALLWTDGRYFIQAKNEIENSEYELMKMGEEVPSFSKWLKENLEDGDSLGFDGKLFSEKQVEDLEAILLKKNIRFIYEFDLVGEIWEDRPELPKGKAFILDKKYAGITAKEKIEQVRAHMDEKKADVFLLSSLDDIAWLFNIRGSDVSYNPVVISYAVITKERAYIFLDKTKVEKEIENTLNKNGIEIKEYQDISSFVEQILGDKTIILDKKKINRWLYKSLPKDIKVIDEMDITTRLKAIKNNTEIKNQRNAYIKDGVALVRFLYWLDSNIGEIKITEITAADKLETYRKEQSLFIEPSFGTISAFGKNAAMAHYSATEESFAVLEAKGLYLVDSGGQYLDGTTDITRTVALGEITEEEKRDFTLTLKAHINLSRMKFLKGTNGYQLDIACRYPLWQEGLDFKHGTGHGIGFVLNVHEGPHRIANAPNDIALEEGMIVSVEPGVYKTGRHGIRIENIVVVKEDIETEFGQFMSFETLSFVPIDLNCIDVKILDQAERKWLNDYHSKVYDKLSPFINKEEENWLKQKTKQI